MGCCGDVVENTIVSSNEIFRKIKKIGKGNYGEIFLIQSNKTQKEYALKVMKTKNTEQELLDIMKREYENLKKLNHPNIISFKCAFESNIKTPLLNIITEYADNGDLEEKLKINLKKKKYFEESELLDWFVQICLALKYMHKNNVIHRDIKPSNIFLMKNNTIKIGDFGISKDISIFHKTRTIIGTPFYIAPEIIQKIPYSFEADIWSLGVTFCHLMSLEFPFDGDEPEEIYENILDLKKSKKILNEERTNYKQEILDKYSKDFLGLIDELMSIEPEKRPSAEQILEKEIVNERMSLCLKKYNYDNSKAENDIQNYEKKQTNDDLKDNFEIKTSGNKKNEIIIEENENENNDNNEKIIANKENEINKKEKANYDFLRQLTCIHQSLYKDNKNKQLTYK